MERVMEDGERRSIFTFASISKTFPEQQVLITYNYEIKATQTEVLHTQVNVLPTYKSTASSMQVGSSLQILISWVTVKSQIHSMI